MPRGRRPLIPSPYRTYVQVRRSAVTSLLVLSAVAAGTSACVGQAGSAAIATTPRPESAVTHLPASATSVLTDTAADVLAAEVARQLFATAPVVVVASPQRPAELAIAASRARHAGAPLLLTAVQTGSQAGAVSTGAVSTGAVSAGAVSAGAVSAGAVSAGAAATTSAALRAEVDDLHPRAVLAVGVTEKAVAAQLPGTHVVTNPSQLPATRAPIPLDHVVLLEHPDQFDATTAAVATTAEVAGATVIPVRGDDPRADATAITALSAAQPQEVLAIGASFGPAERLASRVATAATGVQLPGGGQVVFPGHRLVALYGHPGAPALGALGQQDLSASIARAMRVAASYRRLSKVPVIPAFEIIATVALSGPGRNGDYSGESGVASLRPWVERATVAGMYVVLDLQPGRANLLAQAKVYASLLRLPNVGLALDAEWKLNPGQVPLQQIGSVDVTEVNSVVRWLADLTAEHHLPQKMLVLHQFRLSMIRDEQDLDTSHDDLAIVIHMDGQGGPDMKQRTWNAVTKAAPHGVFFGWKNFYAMDHPTMSPDETMAKTPTPVVITYQ